MKEHFTEDHWVPDIVSKLTNEGIYKMFYTRESAIKALSGCVAADRLIETLIKFEDRIVSQLR